MVSGDLCRWDTEGTELVEVYQVQVIFSGKIRKLVGKFLPLDFISYQSSQQ